MDADRDNGGPAFPVDTAEDDVVGSGFGHQTGNKTWQFSGLTKREYFASKAMQAMIAKSSGQDSTGGKDGVPLIAKYAYEFADAMIAEGAK